MYPAMKFWTAVLTRSSVATVVVVAGRVVGSMVVVGAGVVTATEIVGADVCSVLGASVLATVGGAEAPLLQAVNASAARPK
jgi:hypothetical protein